jgi:hypothetical protein
MARRCNAATRLWRKSGQVLADQRHNLLVIGGSGFAPLFRAATTCGTDIVRLRCENKEILDLLTVLDMGI